MNKRKKTLKKEMSPISILVLLVISSSIVIACFLNDGSLPDDCTCCVSQCAGFNESETFCNQSSSFELSFSCKSARIKCDKQYGQGFPEWFDQLDRDYNYTISLSYLNLEYIGDDIQIPYDLNIHELTLLYNNIFEMDPLALFQYNNRLKVVSFADNWMRTINLSLLSDVEFLGLYDCQLGSLSGNFSKNINLRSLYLNSNYIDQIDEHTFDQNVKLDRLSLWNNQIVDLSFVKPLTKLIYFNIGANFIERIENDTFAYMTELRTLIMDNNPLSYLNPEAFVNLINLELLNLMGCKLTSIPMLQTLSSLTYLDISRNFLPEINHQDLVGLTNLSVLHAYNNFITYIPPTNLTDLSLLTYLDLSNNRIENLTSYKLSQMHNLETLNLFQNVMRGLNAYAFANLTNLKYLIISRNWITYIELNTFYGLDSLLELNLWGNDFVDLDPDIFLPLRSLVVLNMKWQLLKKTNKQAFNGLYNLTSLDLTESKFERIDLSTFSTKYCNITHLDLSKNRLITLQNSNDNSTIRIKSLDLSKNHLSRILKFYFANFMGLESLKLNQNVISYIDADSLNLPSLKHLDLSVNNLCLLDKHLFDNTALISLNLEKNFLIQLDFHSLSNLVYLNIGNNNKLNLKLTADTLPFLKSLLFRSSTIDIITQFPLDKITSLDLSFSQINVYILKTIRFKIIEDLDFSFVKIDREALGRFLANKKAPNLQRLNVSFSLTNGIGVNIIKTAPRLKSIGFADVGLNNSIYEDLRNTSSLNELTVLDLSFNSLQFLKSYYFDQYINLEYLDLKFNNISVIEKQAFGFLTELIYLDLSSNMLPEVYQDAFGLNFLPRIDQLLIINNSLTDFYTILPETIRICDLSDNYLTGVSTAVTDFVKNMQSLNLSRNDITNLTSLTFFKNSNISTLDLCCNRISIIEDNTFQYLSILGNLDLSRNNITTLTDLTLNGLKKVMYLNISNNLLQYIKVDVFSSLEKLYSLDLGRNLIKSISIEYSFSYLYKISRLNIGNNPISIFFVENILSHLNKSIKYITVPIQTVDLSNPSPYLRQIEQSLPAIDINKNIGQYYYLNQRSIAISPGMDGRQFSEKLCAFIASLIQHNIQFNLYTESDSVNFVSRCASWSHERFIQVNQNS